ncbi:hypothetical protein [Paenibacillus sp. RC84]|uniref:hypothetical protein n=1 Tax=Paenibacillus sp. RC84 TaxID=3156252 RepID=UPI0035170DC2
MQKQGRGGIPDLFDVRGHLRKERKFYYFLPLYHFPHRLDPLSVKDFDHFLGSRREKSADL